MRSGAPLGMPLESAHDEEGFDLYVEIWGPDGTQLFRSNRSSLPPRAVLGFSDVEADGNRYRVYSLQTPLQTVQIAQDLSSWLACARANAGFADFAGLAAVCLADAAVDAGGMVGDQPLIGAH